ncbi:restriction endonuclease subunit S [Thermomonas sp.]|uniref:restriction endonuclease subunit S n=1 Tax=Thermomonas sp. TaxID=1971895 RepID=UPI002626347C|nr:restriction endonuclease subunit S [Thermomonas sp.]MCO5055838.1 restriction endonuclease subunit S [Thermomonas sp.]
MSGLPQGWGTAALGEVCNVIRGVTFPASAKEFEKSIGNVCCLRTSNVQKEIDWGDIYFVSREHVKREEQFVRIGDVLMSMANSYELVGKVAVVRDLPYDTAYGAFLAAIRPTPAIDGQYLFHLLRTGHVQAELRKGSSQTTNIANISAKALSEIEAPVAPLPEQTRIADKLDALLARVDAARERLDRVPALLKRFRQSVLAAATSGELTEDWRGGAEAEWDDVTLSEVIAPNRPLCYGVVQPGAEEAGGASLIRVQDMHDGRVLVDELRTIAASVDHDFRRSRVEAGDLLVSVVGTIGRTAIVPAGLNANIARAVARIACRDGIDSRWVRAWLSTDDMQWWLLNSSKEVARKTLNLSDLSTAPIKLPPPDEQAEIIRRVEALFALADKVQAHYDTARARVDKLSPALLAKAFRGELVPQDPSDEPASALLERLRAAKASQPAATKRGRKPAAAAAKARKPR